MSQFVAMGPSVGQSTDSMMTDVKYLIACSVPDEAGPTQWPTVAQLGFPLALTVCLLGALLFVIPQFVN